MIQKISHSIVKGLIFIKPTYPILIPGVPKKSNPVWFVITSKQIKLLKRNNLHQIEEGRT